MDTTPSQNKIKGIPFIIAVFLTAIILTLLAFILTTEAHAYTENFETYNTGDLNGQDSWVADTDIDIDTTFPLSGTKHIKLNPNSTSGKREITTSETGSIIFWLTYSSYPNYGSFALGIGTTEVNHYLVGGYVYMNGNNNLLLNATELVCTMTANTYTKIEIQYDVSVNPDQVRAKCGDGSWTSWINANADNQVEINQIYIQNDDNAITGYIDGYGLESLSPTEDTLEFNYPSDGDLRYPLLDNLNRIIVDFDWTIASSNNCWEYVDMDIWKVATTSNPGSYYINSFYKREVIPISGIDENGYNTIICGGTSLSWSQNTSTYLEHENYPTGIYMFRPKFRIGIFPDLNITASSSQYYLPEGEFGYYFEITASSYDYREATSETFDQWNQLKATSSHTGENIGRSNEEGIIDIIPNSLKTKFPFVYLYQVQELINELNEFYYTASESEQLTSISLTFPAIADANIETFQISVIDQEYIYKILPKQYWDTLKDFFEITIIIYLLFTMIRKLNLLFTNNSDTGSNDEEEIDGGRYGSTNSWSDKYSSKRVHFWDFDGVKSWRKDKGKIVHRNKKYPR